MLANKLELRILEISYKLKLSHISSCLNAVNVIDNIYQVMRPNDKFVLSAGHLALALYVVLEKNGKGNAEELFEKHGVHPNRDLDDGIYVSTGSLGQGLPIAVGIALANKDNDIYVISTDGEMAEGSMWEALRVAGEQRLENLKVAVLANGFSAYQQVDEDLLEQRLQLFYPCLLVRTNVFKYPDWLQGLKGHYHVMSDENYQEILNSLPKNG